MRAVPALLPAKIFLFTCYSIGLFRTLLYQGIDQPFQKIRTFRFAIQYLLANLISIRQGNIERLFGKSHQYREWSILPDGIQNRTEILQSGEQFYQIPLRELRTPKQVRNIVFTGRLEQRRMYDSFVQQSQFRFDDSFSRRNITGRRNLAFRRFEACRSRWMQQFQSGLSMRQNPKKPFVIRRVVADFDNRTNKIVVGRLQFFSTTRTKRE